MHLSAPVLYWCRQVQFMKIEITKEQKELVKEFAEKQNIGGFSNLAQRDLKKATRLDFQYTGLYGEAAWYQYRYGTIEPLRIILNSKFENLRPKKKGDGGFDDSIIIDNETRFLDIKSSHVEDESKIERLNLVIPQRELHDKMIYVAAFVIGPDRQNATHVDIRGWCKNEDVKDRWHYDREKWCVKLINLKDVVLIKNLKTGE